MAATSGNDKLRGSDTADYIGGLAGDDSIWGYEGDDTLEGGKGRDILSGGDGADTFVYAIGDGNDTITDYEEEDVLQFTSGTPKISTKGKDVIFTVGTGSQKGTVTVQNAKDEKVITWIDADGEVHEYPQTVVVDGKKATLQDSYNKDAFNIAEYSEEHEGNFDNVTVIDASAVEQGIHVTGNAKANTITGSAEDDTIEGGKGNDALKGGEGKDTFLYTKGDGNDKILDYDNEDNIQIVNDTVSKVTKSGENFIMKLASGKNISIIGGADKVINYTDANGPQTYPVVFDVSKDGKEVTLKDNYSASSFDVTAYEDFGETARTVDASAVDQDLSIKGNAKNNVIIGADGNNTIEGGKGNDSLTGGTGKNTYVFNSGDGKDVITNYSSGDLIDVTSGTISAAYSGKDLILSVSGGGSIKVLNGKSKYVRVSDAEGTYWIPNPLDNLTYDDNTQTMIIGKGYTDDTFDVKEFEADFAGKVFNITATAATHGINIIGNKYANNIAGSAENDTIEGGTGNDSLTGGDGADTFVYTKGDGNDKILDYQNEDKIQIAGDTVTTLTKSGENFIMKLAGGGKISIIGGANKIVSYTDDSGFYTYPDVIEVSSSGKKVTLKEEYSADTFDVTAYEDIGETARTIDASAVDNDLVVIGNKKNNLITGTIGNNTLIGGKGNDTFTGGSGGDTFVYNPGDGRDVITDYKGSDRIQITDTVKGYSYSGKNLVVTTASGSITVLNGKGKYVRGLDGDGNAITISDRPLGKISYDSSTQTIKLLSGYSDDKFDVNDYEDKYGDRVFAIDASAAKNALEITGNKYANEITGSAEDDTIIGGTGNDSLTGGDGTDTFVYTKGDGNDKILDYQNEDNIQIVDDTVKKITKSGENFVMTLASGKKISLIGGADKVISYTDDSGPHTYPDVITVSADGKKVTLKEEYSADTFDVTAYEDFGETARTIDASAVDNDLVVIGNKKNNLITGTIGNNTLIGGKGNDTFTGGSGGDTFVYNPGDGRDVITDYKGSDRIQITDTVKGYSYSGKNLVVTTASGSITVLNGKGKYVRGLDGDGNAITISDRPLGKISYDSSTQTIKLLSGYSDDKFDVNDYEDKYGDRVFAIDASAAKNALEITGNKYENEITGTNNSDYIEGLGGADKLYGGDGNDSLWGGAGNDTLIGGDGNDTFIYNPGEGTDVIEDFMRGDRIMVLTGDSYRRENVSGDDVTFSFSSGQVVVKNGAEKAITFVDSSGRTIDTYSPY